MTEHSHQDTPEQKEKKNLTDIMIGVGLAFLIYIAGSIAWYQYQESNNTAPATNWVEVTGLTVPNFQLGVNPTIDYVRDIKQAVSSSWSAELRRYSDTSDNYDVVCERSGFSELEPGRAPPATGWTLGSFAGTDCVESLTLPGRHRLMITWELRPSGTDRVILYPISSNAFFIGEVPPNGS